MDCMQLSSPKMLTRTQSFNTASGMDCMQCSAFHGALRAQDVSIPQAVWIACNTEALKSSRTDAWVSIPQAVWIACNGSDKNCGSTRVQFQYRKRYGLHAMHGFYRAENGIIGFNTASGMDCMQFSIPRSCTCPNMVSIPQAVWIACNCLF